MADASSKSYRVAIVGGGLAGVVLGIGLQKYNIPFHIYEAAPNYGEIGAGVNFGPNTIRALAGISVKVLEAFYQHASFNDPSVPASSYLYIRRGDAAGDPAFEKRFDVPGQVQTLHGMTFPPRSCVHRARFLDQIAQLLAPGTTSFNKALARIEESENGETSLRFADGTTETADVVIGCDGIRSTVRQYLYKGEIVPTYTGDYGYRAMVPREAFEAAFGREISMSGSLFLNHGGYIITYPLENSTVINALGVCCRPDELWVHQTWLAPSTADEIQRDLKQWHPELRNIFSKYGTKDRWAIFDLPHDKPYFRGRICLIGDSAHASSPHLGAGGGMAMEDAFILHHLLGDAQSTDDAVRAFKAFDSIRRQRTQKVIQSSRWSARTMSSIGASGGEEYGDEFDANFSWLWEVDLDKDLQQAKKLMSE